MPERRNNSKRSYLSRLHFSGKVIMASVLFGFGLLLVGAILLVISIGGQKAPPLQDSSGEAKKTPMTFVGPGVMGVGAFFVIVGTIMCLFETRILRKRRHTDNETLINSETVPIAAGNAGGHPSTDHHGDIREGNGGDRKNIEETQVKTVHGVNRIAQNEDKAFLKGKVKTPAGKVKNVEVVNVEVPSKESAQDAAVASLETVPVETVKEVPVETQGDLEKFGDKEMSTSPEREQASAFNTSVYVDALDENDNEYYNEDQFITDSNHFSTPPESELEAVVKSFDDHSEAMSKDPGHAPTNHVTELAKENSLLAPNESSPPYIPSSSSVREPDLTEEALHQVPTNPTEEALHQVPTNPTEEALHQVPTNPTEEALHQVPTSPTGEALHQVSDSPTEEALHELPGNPAEEDQTESMTINGQQNENAQMISSTVLPDTTDKASSGADSEKGTSPA